jgi:hypothetical protein
MKKLLYFYFVFTLCLDLSAQEIRSIESDSTSFRPVRLSLTSGIGFSRVENEFDPNYDLNVGFVDFILNYRFNETLGISTGLSVHSMTGNGFNQMGNFSKSRSDFKIPLLLSTNYTVTDKINVVLDLGVYARSIISDEERYLNFTLEDVYSGWGFGFQTTFSFLFDVSDLLSVGINYNSLIDFNEFETNNVNITNQKQSLGAFNALGVVVMYSL